MSELDYDSEFVKLEMWHSRHNRRNGACQVCPRCGGPSTSSCFCAMRRYIDRLSEEDVRKYLEDKRNKRIQEINAELERSRSISLKLENELKNL